MSDEIRNMCYSRRKSMKRRMINIRRQKLDSDGSKKMRRVLGEIDVNIIHPMSYSHSESTHFQEVRVDQGITDASNVLDQNVITLPSECAKDLSRDFAHKNFEHITSHATEYVSKDNEDEDQTSNVTISSSAQCNVADKSIVQINTEDVNGMNFIPESLQEEVKSSHLICDNKIDSGKVKEAELSGRSICNLGHILRELKRISQHWHNNCNFSDLIVTKYQRLGCKTKYFVECQMCHHVDTFYSEPEDEEIVDVNRGAVAGAILTGNGYSQLQEMLAAIDIQCMSEDKYQACHEEMQKAFEIAAEEEMRAAGKEEFQLAEERGDLKNGVPHIPVITDGSWMKRSYRSGKYDSPSGSAIIMGYHSKKILFVGIRNKYCTVCSRALRLNKKPTEHACFKNWGADKSSTSMESDIILEGFRRSIEMHGLVYSTVIADGDSSALKKLRDFSPYPDVSIEKIDCINHLYRNLSRKVSEAGKVPGRGISHLKVVVCNSVMKIRNAVVKAADHRRKEDTSWQMKIRNLRADISNVASHVYGEHKECALLGYFCNGKPKENEKNMVPDLKKSGLFQKVQDGLDYISRFAESLLYNYTSNTVECCNSIISKMTGGKRLHFGLKGSYNARVCAATVQFNSRKALSSACQAIGFQSPQTAVELELSRKHKNDTRVIRVEAERNNQVANGNTTVLRKRFIRDGDYGPKAQHPDLSDGEYSAAVAAHYQRLWEQQQDRIILENNTKMQSACALWRQARKKLITASHFGQVCKRRESTPCNVLVRTILYPPDARSEAISWGQKHESTARKQLAEELNVEIRDCGLFIDPTISYIAATPDGLIGDDTIVEIKCPYSAREFSPLDAIAMNIGDLKRVFDKNNVSEMNKRHDYYYQVQGQLHVTGRQMCIFAVWSPQGLYHITVRRDDFFWKENMEFYLCRFYEQCLVPEIVDSRVARSMPIREPAYIKNALEGINRFKLTNSQTQL